jgi:hypothetical protein
MSDFIRDLLRDKPPVMVLDMGLGSREQSLPVHDGEPVRVVGGIAADPITAGAVRSRSVVRRT